MITQTVIARQYLLARAGARDPIFREDGLVKKQHFINNLNDAYINAFKVDNSTYSSCHSIDEIFFQSITKSYEIALYLSS